MRAEPEPEPLEDISDTGWKMYGSKIMAARRFIWLYHLAKENSSVSVTPEVVSNPREENGDRRVIATETY